MSEQEQSNDVDENTETLANEISGNPPISDKEAEARFIDWYEEICQERIKMSETEEEYKSQINDYQKAEASYERRIKELEQNATDLMKAFEEAEKEAKLLRTKYEPPNDSENTDTYAEPYRVVVKEKMKLLEAQKQNQNRIKTLEDEIKLLRKYVKDFESEQEIVRSKQPAKPNKKGLVVITSSERLEVLEKQNLHLKSVCEQFEKERKDLITKINFLEAKLKSLGNTQTVRKFSDPGRRVKTEMTINKKCVPTFLPKISRASSLSSGQHDFDRRSSTPGTSGARSGFSIRNGYGEIHAKRRSVSSDTSSVNLSYQSIYKYIVQ